jgi:pimeloyl-ACP methyl ester carboxylesterase
VREVLAEKDADEEASNNLPALLYLQGGPGFQAARPTFPLSGWMDAAVKKGYRVLLLDQRGTGMSAPITPASLQRRFGDLSDEGNAAAAADFLSLFRADAIVRDCEVVRRRLCGDDAKLTLLGQSFGGFCILTYLSLFPASLERCCFTFGLAPVGRTADEVYGATFKRMATRNRRFYERYPGDVRRVREIARHLRDQERKGGGAAEKEKDKDGKGGGAVRLPSGGRLTLRRFLTSGLALGSADGYERLHFILEDAWSECDGGEGGGSGERVLSASFLKAMDDLHGFETNPIYWLLHESIYVDGPFAGGSNPLGAPSRWAADRVRSALDPSVTASSSSSSNVAGGQQQLPFSLFDADAVLDATAGKEEGEGESSLPPIYLSGEMVYPWMGDGDFAALTPLRRVAELLAEKDDWPALYDREALRGVANASNKVGGKGVPVAALISYDDIYVERAFSEETADLLGAKVWVTNEFQHSGLRDCPARVFDTLLAMTKGEVALPS